MVVNGVVDFATYERALRHFVALGESGKLVRVGWQTTSAEPLQDAVTELGTMPPVVKADQAQAPLAYGRSAPAMRIDLQIKNLTADKTVFETGQQVFLSATLSRAAHLYCYLSEANGNVIRLLPNAGNPSTLVSANQNVRIPDWMNPNPGFILDAGQPGMESVACLASPTDVTALLPAGLQGPGLRVIEGYKGMDSVRNAYRAVAGEPGLTEKALQWQVVARPAAPR
jgi:hypothetical protein